MLQLILISLTTVITYLITEDASNSAIFIVFYAIGSFILQTLNKSEHRVAVGKIFSYSYLAYWVYALICFVYMHDSGYEWLQSLDGHEVYLPYTRELLEEDHSLFSLIEAIYSDYRFSFVGSILILFVYVGKFTEFLGGDLYLNVQFSLMFLAAFVPVIVYRLFVINNFSTQKSYKYALIYSLLSVHFSQSILIVRDMPITLFHVMIIYLIFKKFSIRTSLQIILCVVMIASLRVSSAIFALVYIVIYLYVNLVRSERINGGFRKIIVTALFIGTLIGFTVYYDQMLSIITEKNRIYSQMQLAADGGESTIASFNALPFGVRHFVKAMYNQFMEIPAFNSMISTGYRPQMYNPMNFPDIYSTFFRYFVWIFVFAGFTVRNTRIHIVKNKILYYNFLVGFLFILVQSTTMGHRRMMGVYPIFFLISMIVYNNLPTKTRNNLMLLTIILFAMLQFVGIYYKYV